MSNNPDFSRHLTPDNWGDPVKKNHDVLIGLIFALFMFFAGIVFDRLFFIGVMHI